MSNQAITPSSERIVEAALQIDSAFQHVDPDYIVALVRNFSAPAQPDCRTCAFEYNRYEEWDCRSLEPCTNGDQYQPAPKVALWRTE